MPVPLTETLYASVPVEVPRKRWTRTETQRLVALGVPGAERLELIDGELINRMGKNQPHVIWLQWVKAWLNHAFGEKFSTTESPVEMLGFDNIWSEPEPDLIVLKQPFWAFEESRPKPADVILLIEISDTTLGLDLNAKANLYARNDFEEYWVIDVNRTRVIRHRDPRNGRYQDIQIFGADEAVNPLAKPEAGLVLSRFPQLNT